jgi:hypothetical protein
VVAPVAQLDRASTFYQILPEPTQPAKKEQVVTRRSKPFSSFLFTHYSQFIPICRELYYVFTTEGGKLLSRQKSTEQAKSKNGLTRFKG